MSRKSRRTAQPRRHRMRRPARLTSARAWILKWMSAGRQVRSGEYPARYGVDRYTAYQEMVILRVPIAAGDRRYAVRPPPRPPGSPAAAASTWRRNARPIRVGRPPDARHRLHAGRGPLRTVCAMSWRRVSIRPRSTSPGSRFDRREYGVRPRQSETVPSAPRRIAADLVTRPHGAEPTAATPRRQRCGKRCYPASGGPLAAGPATGTPRNRQARRRQCCFPRCRVSLDVCAPKGRCRHHLGIPW